LITLGRAASIDDLRLIARRRLPRFAFDVIDGGAETETNLTRNSADFADIELVPRCLRDVSRKVTETEIFGKTYAVPFGLCPLGFLNLAWPGADLMWARLAAARNIPHIISSNCSTPLEEVAEAAEGRAWFQLYVSKEPERTEALLRRVEAAGIDVLAVTVDTAESPRRDRDIRNRMVIPFRMTPEIAIDLALHPRWALGTLRDGAPGLGNHRDAKTPDGRPMTMGELRDIIITNSLTWDGLRELRDRWKGRLLLKGVQHPQDAVMAAEAGCDGVIVSNHGGRQSDCSPTTISVLPEIAEAVAGRFPVMLDSGIRRGTDVVRALCSGAAFAFCGRAFAYGAGAGGEAGVAKAWEIMHGSLVSTMGQIGCVDVSELGPHYLRARRRSGQEAGV
jgi:(S)-mandelate dehydrogenase